MKNMTVEERSIPYENLLCEKFQLNASEYFRNNDLDVRKPVSLKVMQRLLKRNASTDIILYATYLLGEIFRLNLGGGKWTISDDKIIGLVDIGGLDGYDIKPFKFVRKCLDHEDVELYQYYESWNDLIHSVKGS